MKKILLTTDLSNESKSAFPMAIDLARKYDAEIILISFLENPAKNTVLYAAEFPIFNDPEINNQLKLKIEKELNTIKTSLFTGIKLQVLYPEANQAIYSEILQFAENNNIDLIVMSSHGRSGISRLLIGSVTEKVVREARCPVLVVPPSRQ